MFAMHDRFHLASEPVSASAQPATSAERFEDLVDAEHARLFGALFLITHDRSEAEDVMQEAFLRVWERWERVQTLEDPVGYLYRTALNVYRKRRRRAIVAIRRAIRVTPPKDELAEVEIHDQVLRALAKLTPRQRLSVVLLDLLDIPSEEAGRLMGVKSSTVRVLASQGRAALARNMGEEDE
jgi:RNA polymerase sigma-70 factor (ECF subfamily)